jgi:hypothetical protein
MASAGEADHNSSQPSVFLSYASEDRSAARSIRDALTDAGLEVWYDENELGGGDEWDQKIRRQIRECDYFMPVISARTDSRLEGYFRREWRLAVDRTLDMADGHVFLVPVVIDDTEQTNARVPDRFVSVQWIKVPNGQMNGALRALCVRLVAGNEPAKAGPRRAGVRNKSGGVGAPLRALPDFPVEEPGQRVKFWVHVAGWALKSAWIMFQRLPRWVRIIAYIWMFLLLISRGCSRKTETHEPISPETAAKLKAISEVYQGSSNKADIGKLGADIARAFASEDGDSPKDQRPLLAIPFAADAKNAVAARLADSTFALVFGRLSISKQGKVGLNKEPMAFLDTTGAAERGRASHATYVLCGGIENGGAAPVLTVDIVAVADGSVSWTKSYPTANADAATIAADIESHVPSLEDD